MRAALPSPAKNTAFPDSPSPASTHIGFVGQSQRGKKRGKGQTQKTGLTWVLGAEEAARGLCVRAGSVASRPAIPHAGKAEPLGAGLEGKEQDTSSTGPAGEPRQPWREGRKVPAGAASPPRPLPPLKARFSLRGD